MRTITLCAVVTSLLLSLPAPVALADSDNWSPSKRHQIERNRNSDSGLGNGGEKRLRDINKETNRTDLDPGRSDEQAQGGKNDGSWDK